MRPPGPTAPTAARVGISSTTGLGMSTQAEWIISSDETVQMSWLPERPLEASVVMVAVLMTVGAEGVRQRRKRKTSIRRRRRGVSPLRGDRDLEPGLARLFFLAGSLRSQFVEAAARVLLRVAR